MADEVQHILSRAEDPHADRRLPETREWNRLARASRPPGEGGGGVTDSDGADADGGATFPSKSGLMVTEGRFLVDRLCLPLLVDRLCLPLSIEKCGPPTVVGYPPAGHPISDCLGDGGGGGVQGGGSGMQ